MTLAKCPLCRSAVGVAGVKPASRLTCGKCHADLHLGQDGRLVVGGPREPEDELQELKQQVRQLASQLPIGKVVTGLAVFLVLGLGYYALFGPAERLDSVAERAATALAANDPVALESLAAPGTSDDLRRWYDAVHPRLVQLRTDWGEKDEVVEAVVAHEDHDQHKGTVGVSIRPAASGARDVSLANPVQATASATSAFEQGIHWTLTRWGRWKIDGQATLSTLPKK